MKENLTKKDLDRIQSMLSYSKSVMSAHEFLHSDYDVLDEIASSLQKMKHDDLSRIGLAYEEDFRFKLRDHFGDLVRNLCFVNSYHLLSRCVDDDSDKTKVLRLAAEDIIENDLKEVIECLETLEEKIKEYLIETDQM